MTGRSRFRFRFRGVMSLVKSIASQFFDILQKEEASSNTNVFYDPADLTSLRVGRDGSGGNPTVGDPVGMLLDTSQFGGKTAEDYLASQPELVTNGTFDSDTDGWAIESGDETLSVVSGRLRVTYGADGLGSGETGAYQELTGLTVGAWYRFSVGNRWKGTNGAVGVRVRAPNFSSATLASFYGFSDASDESIIFQATYATAWVHVYGGYGTTGTYVEVDNISVKEIPGHHAIAPSDSARPVLLDDPDLTAAALTDNGQRGEAINSVTSCLLYTSPSPRDRQKSRMPSSA